MCTLHKLSHCLCRLLPCKALSDVFRRKGSINKFDLAFFSVPPRRGRSIMRRDEFTRARGLTRRRFICLSRLGMTRG